ncbi:MAG TPA: hypothetical protein VF895_02335 [Gaiellaceae bacterium]
MRARVETADGVFTVDLEAEEVLGFDADEHLPAPEPVELPLPGVIAVAARGSTRIAVVDRRPPIVVSYDAGVTWTESGGGLPAGHAVAIDNDDPDLVLFAARNRLYLSRDGGRFWHALTPELPEIRAVAFTAV